jgi:pyridoxal phosphate enzyme (YggS family)
MELAERLRGIQERIGRAARRAGRQLEEVHLVAVSKQVGIAPLQEARSAGLSLFGENRVQEALTKISALGPGIEWHFIGYLQRNKVKAVVGRFELIHSLESLLLAQEVHRCCERVGQRQRVLIEVNVSGEPSKHGVALREVEGLVKELVGLPLLQVEGLMTIPPHSADPQRSRPYFRSLRELRERLSEVTGKRLMDLSMGMSNDFEVAIEEGATYVRIGTALFGERTLQRVSERI